MGGVIIAEPDLGVGFITTHRPATLETYQAFNS